ncbi:MAG: hypothetical protein AAFU79_01420 [Myxococcota bacterium]
MKVFVSARLGIVALLIGAMGAGCGVASPSFSEPVHFQSLVVTGEEGGRRLYAAGFGDSTLRGYEVGASLTLDEVLWSGGAPGPVNLGSIGPTLEAQLVGAWGLTVTSSGGLVASSRLGHAVLLFGGSGGPLSLAQAVRQGEVVERAGGSAGLVAASGLDRVGPVEVEGNWLYSGGSDALGLFSLASDALEFRGSSSALRGADDLLALPGEGAWGRVVLTRCRAAVVGGACLSASDPAELLVVTRDADEELGVASRLDDAAVMVGNGALAATTTSSGSDLVLAVFEGSSTVQGYLVEADGTLTSTGSRRLVAPYWDPAALPPLSSGAASTSTSAPLLSGQIALLGEMVFVAVRSGGFVAHFPLSCLGQANTAAECLNVTCLDAEGGCAGPSAASITPHYPFTVAIGGARVYVGVDVVDSAGRVTTKIAILETQDGAVTLIELVDG